MSTPREQARNGLLLDGRGKPLDLNAIHWQFRRQNPSASPAAIQNEALELVRCLVSGRRLPDQAAEFVVDRLQATYGPT
jgi:hypothetical protein